MSLFDMLTIGQLGTDIYLDLEQLRNEAILLNDKKIQEINRDISAINSTVNRLTLLGWAGESREVFIEKFSVYKKDMGVFCEYLKEFNKQLKTIHSNGRKLKSQSRKISSVL